MSDDNSAQSEALINAIQQKTTALALELIKAGGIDCNMTSKDGTTTALIEAAISNEIEVLKALIQAGADPNIPDRGDFTALSWAARLGHIEIVLALIEAKADPNIPDCDRGLAIWWAFERGHTKIVETLRAAGSHTMGFI